MILALEILKLFFIFFKIGLFTFGGGYAMIPMINQELVGAGYFTVEELTYLIGISEATPGPFSVNIASLSGFFVFEAEPYWLQLTASVFATIGVTLPSFIIILLFSVFSHKIITKKPYKDAFKIVEPMTIGFIFAAFLSITTQVLFGNFMAELDFDYIAAIIFGVVLLIALLFKKISPVTLVGISALLGIIFYGLI